MSAAGPGPWSSAALVMFAAGLAGALWRGGAEVAPPGTPAAAPTELALPLASPTPAPVDAWASTALARPLFDPRRRPAAAEGPGTPAVLPRLSGVLIGPAERLAIFAGVAGGAPQVVREGGSIGAHVVQAIRPGEAVLAGPLGPLVLRPGFETR